MLVYSFFLASGILSQTEVCDGQYFCAVFDGKSCMTIHSASSGWAALGTGDRMSGSDMYFVSKSQAANLAGTGHVQPDFKANLGDSAVLSTPPSWAQLSKSFCLTDSQISSIKSGTQFIYASSRSAPSGSGSSLSFSQHDFFSSLQADFNVAGNTTSNSNGPILKTDNMEAIVLTHGIVLFIAWMVAPAAGVFVARYLKDALGQYWYPVHAGLLGVVSVLGNCFGIIYMFLYRAPRPGHFDAFTDLGIDFFNVGNSHVKLGLLVGILAIAQAVLGVLINKWYNPNRSATPLSDKIHWWLGRIVILLGILNVFLGSFYYEDLYSSNSGKKFAIAGFVLLVAAVLSFVGGEYFIGQKHHNGSKPNSEQEMMLSS